MKFKITLIFSALLQLALSCSSTAYSQGGSVEEKEKKQFTFSWQFQDTDAMRPRGGTTKGSTVELSNKSKSAFTLLINFKVGGKLSFFNKYIPRIYAKSFKFIGEKIFT